MFKADVRVAGNMIDGRQGWAYVCNSGNVVVLEADMDKKQKYEDFKVFDKVRVGYTHRDFSGTIETTLEAEKGVWTLGSGGTMLKGDFNFYDKLESIKASNYPKVEEGSLVAVALYSKENEIASLLLFKVGKVDTNCMTVAKLNPLNDEEMEEIKKDVQIWCNR